MGKTQSLLQGKAEQTPNSEPPVKLKPSSPLENQILGTIYGNCIGDAIGLMTEFLDKRQATHYFGKKHVEYPMKELTAAKFLHQWAFQEADWTDDSDQMILILQSLMENDGKASPTDFAARLLDWLKQGFPELGDTCGMGIGGTTWKVLNTKHFRTDPHKAAEVVWEDSKRFVAPNGGVMRTSIVGVHRYNDIDQVISNTKDFCKVTHADPRCIASCVAVTTAISMMLQGLHKTSKGGYDVVSLTEAAFDYAKVCLLRDEEGILDEAQVEELRFHMNASDLSELQLDEKSKIGYTFKCLGTGFWALRQKKFRDAIQTIMLEGGDADTNGAVAGALLGCKLGYNNLPSSWRDELKYKNWLDKILIRYLKMGIITDNSGTPVDEPQEQDGGNGAQTVTSTVEPEGTGTETPVERSTADAAPNNAGDAGENSATPPRETQEGSDCTASPSTNDPSAAGQKKQSESEVKLPREESAGVADEGQSDLCDDLREGLAVEETTTKDREISGELPADESKGDISQSRQDEVKVESSVMSDVTPEGLDKQPTDQEKH